MCRRVTALIIFWLIAFLPAAVTAAPLCEGQDYYALQSSFWNNSATLSYNVHGGCNGNLHNTFGTSLTPVAALLSSSSPSYFRVHIINTVCVRDNNCGAYEIGHGYSKSTFNAAVAARKPAILTPLKNQAKAYCDLFAAHPATHLVISPALEHDLSIPSWRILADAVLSVCPSAQLSNSPDGGIAVERYRGAWIERHGSNPQSDSDIVSLDGANADQIDIGAFLTRVRRLPNIKLILLWTAGYNCRVGTWQDPRVRKNCSSGKTLELMNHLTDALPAPPHFTGSQCKKITAFKAPSIWKPLAESQVNPDPRSELPVLIIRGFGKAALNVLASNGAKQGVLAYYGTYLDQGLRYYSGYTGGSKGSGYDFQKGAENATGNGGVFLQQGTICTGPLFPGRRQGLMRDN